MDLIFKDHIVEKLWTKHQVTEDEVKSAVRDAKRVFIRAKAGQVQIGQSKRFLIIARTNGGRILRIIIEEDYNRYVVVTAFDAPESDKRRYRRR